MNADDARRREAIGLGKANIRRAYHMRRSPIQPDSTHASPGSHSRAFAFIRGYFSRPLLDSPPASDPRFSPVLPVLVVRSARDYTTRERDLRPLAAITAKVPRPTTGSRRAQRAVLRTVGERSTSRSHCCEPRPLPPTGEARLDLFVDLASFSSRLRNTSPRRAWVGLRSWPLRVWHRPTEEAS